MNRAILQHRGNMQQTNLLIQNRRVFSEGIKFTNRVDRVDALDYVRNPENFAYNPNFYYQWLTYNRFGQRVGQIFEGSINPPANILWNGNDFYDNPDDLDDTVQTMYLFQWRKPRRAGGNDEFNNCLYWCLNHSVGCESCLPKEINSPRKFKDYLNIDQKSRVDISLIPKLESLFVQKSKTKDDKGNYINEQYCSITVSGDYEYHSPFFNTTCLNINIRLKNGHYELINNIGRSNEDLIKHYIKNFFPIPRTKSQVFSYYENYVYTFDETDKFYTVTNLQKFNMRNDNILVRTNIKKSDLKCDNDIEAVIFKSLKECYNSYIKNADELLAMNGPNAYKYSGINSLTMDYFRMKSEIFKLPEESDSLENQFINGANGGGLNYSKKGRFENVYEYDKTNCYASQFCSESLMPTKKPKYYFITQPNSNKYFKFGIYRAYVEIPPNAEYKHVFQLKMSGYYTHICLNLAIDLGYNVILTIDDKYNACVYEDGLVKMHHVFRKYQQYFYELKSNKIAKQAMSMIYGCLSERNKKYMQVNVVNEVNPSIDVNLDDITDIKFSINSNNNDNFDIKSINIDYVEKGNYYKNPQMARISPFLTALVRKLMASYVRKIPLENIVRIHTDSICTIGRVASLDKLLGDKMGAFKLKQEDKSITIISQNNFTYGEN